MEDEDTIRDSILEDRILEDKERVFLGYLKEEMRNFDSIGLSTSKDFMRHIYTLVGKVGFENVLKAFSAGLETEIAHHYDQLEFAETLNTTKLNVGNVLNSLNVREELAYLLLLQPNHAANNASSDAYNELLKDARNDITKLRKTAKRHGGDLCSFFGITEDAEKRLDFFLNNRSIAYAVLQKLVGRLNTEYIPGDLHKPSSYEIAKKIFGNNSTINGRN